MKEPVDALVPSTPEERLKQKAERKALRLARRRAELQTIVAEVEIEAAKIVSLRKYAFKDEQELDAAGLNAQEKRIVRSWEVPKRETAFAVESSARQIEAKLKGQAAENKAPTINVQNAFIELPEKRASEQPAVIIDVEPGK